MSCTKGPLDVDLAIQSCRIRIFRLIIIFLAKSSLSAFYLSDKLCLMCECILVTVSTATNLLAAIVSVKLPIVELSEPRVLNWHRLIIGARVLTIIINSVSY